MNAIQILEQNCERVLTTEQLAHAYECGARRISENFTRNATRFEEGKHYYKIEGNELKDLQSANCGLQISPMARVLYLWTRRGASRHSKCLGTNKAWDMFDQLEENYFNPRPKALTPEEQMAQGLLAAQQLLTEKNKQVERLIATVEEQKPKVLFADAVSASKTSILIGDLAKLIRQNGIDIGQKRLFEWLRANGWLMKNGTSKNMPTQKSMEMQLFEVKEGSYVDSNGVNVLTKTTKVTGKGQQYFVNKFLGQVGR